MENKEDLLRWLKEHDLIAILRLEKKLKMPNNSISMALREIQPLADHWIPNLAKELKKYGYKSPVPENA